MATGTEANPIYLSDDDEPAPKRAKKEKGPRKARTEKPKPSTLMFHTDGCPKDNSALKRLGFTPTIPQSCLHMVDSTFLAGLDAAEPAAKCFSKPENPASHRLRRFHVKAGNLVIWLSWTVHSNENPDCPNGDVIDCEHDVSATTIEGTIAKLKIYGVAILKNVASPVEQQAVIDGLTSDLYRSAPRGTPFSRLAPPGSKGCLIVKNFGLPNTKNAQANRLNPTVRDFFAKFYQVRPEELTQSNDGYTWKPGPDGRPKRCGIFISWGPYACMGPKEAAAKLNAAEAGKSSSHNPFRYRVGGGAGHMSNPALGKPGHWDILLDPIGPAQRQAFGIRS